MSKRKPRHHGHRFPSQIISDAILLYHRFSLSLGDVEDLLAERGIEVSCEGSVKCDDSRAGIMLNDVWRCMPA